MPLSYSYIAQPLPLGVADAWAYKSRRASILRSHCIVSKLAAVFCEAFIRLSHTELLTPRRTTQKGTNVDPISPDKPIVVTFASQRRSSQDVISFVKPRKECISLSLLESRLLCRCSPACGTWARTSSGRLSLNPISNNSVCRADPANPQYGFCGYVGATCSTSDDCDYGVCNSGKCGGYMGDTCSSDLDCMAFFNCSPTDGTCGGAGATCANGNQDCTSDSCDTSGKCAAPPSAGMADGSPCGSDTVCSSGSCGSSYQCASSTSLTASQKARLRHKRRSTGPGKLTHGGEVVYREDIRCPRGQTACALGLSSENVGYECVDTTVTLESCGGCIPLGLNETMASNEAWGTDCTTLPNVDIVSCSSGACKISSCLPGFNRDPDSLGCF
ncbi:uncharacterized protein L969DRAFT_617455 [Mixia osmundae IAM 14324]|uniref:uncharacterized protein n=1 Tax=Mixia osmundae (strain CBS 9802 / IAM 14324 / JCM 22182 / KY 12970) TaxID=764103 RepID=UPI0004A55259|nr:uncharacterized protein L969DRAFT_617455 [Mixia osmundae IAM 14324]KEI40754.1 hypothetical protein L969DRAFT_617455 [Mixia osmundae IAM 14324]